ncbi:MAG: hypothetical protein IJ204_03550 [Paludibacteraceae bacterium]|nr:hypothetical protein [Paludibacteraceae bacterium]
MKKILLAVMVAFAFMACNNNGASVPSNDKKALKAVTSQATELLGQTQETVEQSLTKAGFVKMEGELAQITSRAIARVQKAKTESETIEVQYMYNMPENALQMDEKEAEAYMNQLLAKGECAVIAVGFYRNGILGLLSTTVMAPLKDNINLLFTENSDAMYKLIPTTTPTTDMPQQMNYWQGRIYASTSDADKEATEYTDHAAFVAAVAAANSIDAEESAEIVTKMDMTSGKFEGFFYSCFWSNPDADSQAEMLEENGYVAAIGNFSVSVPQQ